MTSSHASAGHSASQSSEVTPPASFNTTHWSVVLRAGCSDTTQARAALEKLCLVYWYPLYAFVRRRGYSPEDSKDLTQAFFLRLFEHQSLAHANPALGRFRSFMLGAMNHFLISEWKHAHAQRRGGNRELVSLDWVMAEQRYDLQPSTLATADQVFDRQWATALLDEVLRQIENVYLAEGKEELFRALKQTLTGRRETQPYAVLAKQLNMSKVAVKVAVHRLRKRYRTVLQAEIARTVNSEEEIKDELTYLFQAMASS